MKLVYAAVQKFLLFQNIFYRIERASQMENISRYVFVQYVSGILWKKMW